MVISAILCFFGMTGTPACFWPLPGWGLAIHTTRAAAFSAERVFNLQKAASERNRVASGEYRIVAETNEGGIGPFAPGIHNFRESWTMWRVSDDGLEVEAERDYESPKGELHTDKSYIRMSSAFRILGVREFRKLRWRPDYGPLSCDLLRDTLVCTAVSSDPNETLRWDMPAKEPYGYFWPLSAFSLASITRSTNRSAVSGESVQIVTLHEPNTAFPIFGTVIDGELKYLGQEDITVANRRWIANKFILTFSFNSRFVMWVAPNGLPLAFGRDNGRTNMSEVWLSLVSLQQYADF